jgi:cbb3-type cytochrome oxidase maturation protein
MYFMGWTILLAISLGTGLAMFVWAMRSGQFAEQDRARYLPLADGEGTPPWRSSNGRPPELYAMAVVLVLGLMAMIGAILLTLRNISSWEG